MKEGNIGLQKRDRIELKTITNNSCLAIFGDRSMPVAAGGIIVSPNLDVERDVVCGATAMWRKFTLAGPGDPQTGLSINGARIGIKADPNDLTEEGLREIFILIGDRLNLNLGTAASIGVTAAQVNKAINRIVPHPQYGVIQGLGLDHERADHNFIQIFSVTNDQTIAISKRHNRLADVATGFAAVKVIDTITKLAGQNLTGKTVAIQGFGAVGGSFAFAVEQLGAKVVFIGNTAGVFDCTEVPVTIPLSELTQETSFKLKPDNTVLSIISGRPNDILGSDCDVLVLAGPSGTIYLNNQDQVRAPLILELANMALTKEASELLQKKGTVVVPHESANIGNATAYAVAAMRGPFEEPKSILDAVLDHIGWVNQQVWETSQTHNCSLTEAVNHLVQQGNLWTHILEV